MASAPRMALERGRRRREKGGREVPSALDLANDQVQEMVAAAGVGLLLSGPEVNEALNAFNTALLHLLSDAAKTAIASVFSDPVLALEALHDLRHLLEILICEHSL